MSPAADAIGPVMPAWICAVLRAMFHTRGSSRMPWNAPLAVPVDVNAAARPACWMLSKRGVNAPTASVVSSTPLRYRRHVEPS